MSIALDYNARCAAALTTSLNNIGRHGRVTKPLLHQLRNYILRSINSSHQISSFILKQLPSMLRVRQYLCINNSALDISYQGAPYLLSSITP
eukprot:221349-Pelagomonas_calceolata.AAC.1